MKNTDIGRLGENCASHFLKSNGYKVIGRNVHVSRNELDIIARNKEYIVFVEVKTRSTDKELYTKSGTPASAVNYEKRRRTVQAARAYLYAKKIYGLQPRFDVIEVFLDRETHGILYINHIINAFGT